MRAAHRAAQQPVIHKWDVFERPFWTWDTYDRPYYTWDVFERAVTAWARTDIPDEVMGATAFNISFSGGHYYTYESPSFMFNASTGKFSLITSGVHLIDSSTTTAQLNNAYISDESGQYVGRIFLCYTSRVIKNTELSRFEYTANSVDNGYYAVATAYGKGAATGDTVESFVNTTYPADGYDVATELYYVRRTGTTLTPTGLTVESFAADTYPLNGYDAGTDLYYIRKTYTKTPTGNTAYSVGDDTYPQLGYDAVTDLWYERRTI